MASVWCAQGQGLIAGWDSTHPIFESDNALRVIKYVVILGYRYSSYNLVRMQIHDSTVVADLNRHAPQVPNPEELTELDGTFSAANENIERRLLKTLNIPQPHEVAGEVECWWTGPWPVLHAKISKSTPEGFVFEYQAARDILGTTQIKKACLYVDDPSNPINNETYLQLIVEDVVAKWLAEQLLHMGVFMAGIVASILCMACEKLPNLWPEAAFAIGVYIGLFVADILVSINDICELTSDAWSRFWMIVLVGLGLLLTIAGVNFILPYFRLWAAEAAAEEEAGLLILLANGMSDMSVVFFVFKMVLVLWVFIAAVTVFIATIAGWI